MNDYEMTVSNPEKAPFWERKEGIEGAWFDGSHPVRHRPLPPGSYTVQHNSKYGFYIALKKVTSDELLLVRDERTKALCEEIETFFASGHRFKDYGFAHRRGILLHGPSGSGKSCLLRSIAEAHIAAGGYILYAEHCMSMQAIGVNLIQKVIPGAKVMIVIEELEEFIDEHGEPDTLNVLDGAGSMDGVLVVATTNHPEKLNRRIVNRPRRFDRVIFVGMPSASMRREYFLRKLRIKEHEVDQWVAASHNFSFAALADLVISVKCLGNPLAQEADRLREMLVEKPTEATEWKSEVDPKPKPEPTPAEANEPLELATQGAHPFVKEILDRFVAGAMPMPQAPEPTNHDA